MGLGARAFDGALSKDSSMWFVIPPGLLHSKSNSKIPVDLCSVIVCQTESESCEILFSFFFHFLFN